MSHERTRRKRYAHRDREGRTRPVFGVDPPPPVTKGRPGYIARASCGHVLAAWLGDLPRAQTQLLARDAVVERVTAATARRHIDDDAGDTCNVCVPPTVDQVGAGL